MKANYKSNPEEVKRGISEIVNEFNELDSEFNGLERPTFESEVLPKIDCDSNEFSTDYLWGCLIEISQQLDEAEEKVVKYEKAMNRILDSTKNHRIVGIIKEALK